MSQSPKQPTPPKPRIPLPRKPPKTIVPDSAYRRKPKHPKRDLPPDDATAGK